MRLIAFHTPVTATAETAPSMSDMLVDLDEFVHPGAGPAERERLVALAQLADGTPAVRLPADPDRDDGRAMRRAGISTVALSDVRSADQVQAAAALLAPGTRLALELRTGAALRDGEALAAAAPGVAALWYAFADLVVDFDAAPPDLYLYDNPEPRLASPAWARGRMLTIARALGLELWGQLDLTFAAPPPPDRLRYTLDCARNSGFDALIVRHIAAARAEMPVEEPEEDEEPAA